MQHVRIGVPGFGVFICFDCYHYDDDDDGDDDDDVFCLFVYMHAYMHTSIHPSIHT